MVHVCVGSARVPAAVNDNDNDQPAATSGRKIGWSDFRRGSSLPSAPSAAGAMFSKLKSQTSSSSVSQGAQVLATNNIINLFEIGKLVCSAGPELIWKVYEGYRKPDGKVSTIYYFNFFESFMCSKYIIDASLFTWSKLIKPLFVLCSYPITCRISPVYPSNPTYCRGHNERPTIATNRYPFLEIIDV